VTEAGVVLETLDKVAETKGYIVPLDLGAKGRSVALWISNNEFLFFYKSD
jgi:FAD/FMN-containing dehydrogenase